MRIYRWLRRGTPSLGGDPFLLPLLLSAALMGCRTGNAMEPPPAEWHGSSFAAAPAAETLCLADCLRLALQRQPRVAAQQASLSAALDGQRALETLGFPASLAREVPVRRRQANLGVSAAAAGLDQAQRDATYAVTRAYYSVLYAREQEGVAADVVERLSATRDAAQRAVDNGAKDTTVSDVQRATVYLHLAEARRTQATQGVLRALASLAEAIGLGPEACIDVPSAPLPVSDAHPNRDDVVAAALARRGELVQASVFVDLTCLEVEAQGTDMHQRMQTFAAGADVHGHSIPQEIPEPEYRPGAVPPEMPAMLVGSRSERMQHARSLNARAVAALETARNLTALEARDAFLRWEEASVAVHQAHEAAEAGDKLADDQSKQLTAGLKVKIEDVVSAHVLAAQARSQYNEFRYRELLALADLERVTAGGFCAGSVETVTSEKLAAPSPGPAAK